MGQKDEGCAADQVSDRIFTVPNIISFVRLCLVPVFLVLLLNGFNVAATLLYALAAGTDWIDGQIARRTNAVSRLGQLLDPAVDRILMISGVCGLFLVGRLPLWIILVVLVRDLLLLVGGAVLLKRFRVRVAVIFPGKVATTLLFVGFAGLLLRMLGHSPDEEPEEVTEEEIRMMVDVGEEKGVIEQSEKDMINNIFEFDDRSVAAVMTHRTETTAVEATASLEEIVQVAMETGYSRIPVYEDDLDNIIGIIYAKDLLQFIGSEREFNIHNCMRPPLFIPESTRCTELFKELKSRKLQMAVIVDEYGGTYGIVTMEDLLESIVGNIQDEYDNEAEEISVQPDGAVTFDGSVSLDEVERQLGIEFEDDVDSETLSGVLTDKLGRIPKAGEHPQVTIQNTLFTVVEMDGRRISKIRAETLPDDGQDEPV